MLIGFNPFILDFDKTLAESKIQAPPHAVMAADLL